MKINVIAPLSHQIEMRIGGTLAIIGKNQHSVVLMASNVMFPGADISKFARNEIHTTLIGESSTTLIFERNQQGELRNPQKFLKSIRNKLTKAILAAEQEFANEMNDLEHQMSKAYH